MLGEKGRGALGLRLGLGSVVSGKGRRVSRARARVRVGVCHLQRALPAAREVHAVGRVEAEAAPVPPDQALHLVRVRVRVRVRVGVRVRVRVRVRVVVVASVPSARRAARGAAATRWESPEPPEMRPCLGVRG